MDKIICLGKNYRDHAIEMGGPVPEKPVLFLKPPSVALFGREFGVPVHAPLPLGRGAVHHECEIVLRVGAGGSDLSLEEARRAVDGATLGLDMTLRDLQNDLRKKGHPWEISKVFPGSAIVGRWLEGVRMASLLEAHFELTIDGAVRQRGHARQMTMGWADAVAYASQYFPLVPGDLIFTGTPAGVGPVTPGQVAALTWGDERLLEVVFEPGA